MKFLLLALLTTPAFARQLCIGPDSFSALENIIAFAQKCQQGDLVVTPVCKISDGSQRFITLWTVSNISASECEDNSNFSHNLSFNNLKIVWPVGASQVCGAYWNGSGNLTLNVAGNNNNVKINDASDCSPAQVAQAKSLCGLNPLPVTISAFSAKFEDKCVSVAFATATESNSDNVQIERSLDGKNFSMIAGGQIPSNSPNGGKYSAKDCEDKIKGTYYYRLKQNDKDGKSEVFNVVTVNVSKTTFETSLFPNPTSDELNVKFDTTGMDSVNYAIYDSAGKLVSKEKVQVEKLSQGFKIPVKNQTNGVYTIKLTNDKSQEIHNGKFIKE